MRRLSQDPLGWLLLLAGAAAALAGALFPARARDDPPAASTALTLPEGYTEKVPGTGVRFALVGIPGGTFLMGSPKEEKGRRDDEGPQHAVTIRPFWMGKYEVTWDEYDLFYKNNPGLGSEQRRAEKAGAGPEVMDALSRPTPPYMDETFGFGHDRYPVVSVTHHAAMTYCRWLSRQTGRTYRLPTEAEWEWACRAGTRTAYFFGDDPARLDEYAWYAENSEEATHPVGSRRANPWGLHDMLGNVAEWCLDSYDKGAYAGRPADKPALGPLRPPTADRFPNVVRGGWWDDKAPALRCAARVASDRAWNKRDPARPPSIWWLTDGEGVGFRVVRPVEEQDALKGLRPKVTWDSK
jgi:formylglycine-generating enzyme required for sulfatase activity